ncbi:Endogenous retrovirus group K member 113 Pol protein [Lonchura striata]|uniref:Endogenous retrovirus group K member 113 Pol protein n=1 Tax=Lonchura striata TaxID=40157 RepID=A0A218ULI6_9PASE|nr:Endogenous retrovirus group K member 113 Pol protein [Lonchura striata domestica]
MRSAVFSVLALTEALHLKDTDWQLITVDTENRGTWRNIRSRYIIIGDTKHMPVDITIDPCLTTSDSKQLVAFRAAVTEEHPTQKLNWLSDTPVCIEQWPLNKQKLEVLQKLMAEQLAKGNIQETTSPWNSPIFIFKKPGKDEWQLLHNLREINKVIEDMGPLQPGMPSPTMLPQDWNLAVINIKNCFFQIPLHPDDAPHFAFSVPSINQEAPVKRYHWKVLPQGLKNSPTICQWYVSSLLGPVCAANNSVIIHHYIDDILVCAPNDDLLTHVLEMTTNALVVAGFELHEDKVQRMPPWGYLGLEIGKRAIVLQKLVIKNNIETLADVQQLCGSLNWWKGTRREEKDRDQKDPLLIIEWVFLSHQRTKRMTQPQELVAELIRKARARIRELAGSAPVQMAPLPEKFQQAKISHQLYHQNAPGLVRQFQLTRDQAQAIVATCPSWERVADAEKHLIQAFSTLGIPKGIKTDNAPAYTSKDLGSFLQQWGIEHKTGIPYSPSGQAVVERTHQSLKRVLRQQQPVMESPQVWPARALFTINFLNCSFENLNPPIIQHFHTYLEAKFKEKPLVMIKNPEMRQQEGPYDLVAWGCGYACVSTPSGLRNVNEPLSLNFSSEKHKKEEASGVVKFIANLQEMSNSSSISPFLLLALADTWQLQLLHFCLLLGISLAALLCNGLIISAAACGHHLHMPMLFFLLNLALSDLGSICTTVPKAMHNSLWDTRGISYSGYMSICKHLHYGTLLGSRACAHMAAAAWASGFLTALLHMANTFSLPLCQGNALGQFFCEIPQVLKLSCSHSKLRELELLAVSAFLSFASFAYLKPHSLSFPSLDLAASVLYSVVPPALNLLIYSLRNQELKDALRKMMTGCFSEATYCLFSSAKLLEWNS